MVKMILEQKNIFLNYYKLYVFMRFNKKLVSFYFYVTYIYYCLIKFIKSSYVSSFECLIQSKILFLIICSILSYSIS